MGDFRQGVLWRYDPTTKALQRITSNGEPRDIAAVGDQVYVAVDGNAFTGLVARYDAATGERSDSLDLLACAVASGDGVVWAAGCPFAQRLSTDGRRLRKLREVFLPYRDPGTASTSRVAISRAGRRRRLAVGAGRRARPPRCGAWTPTPARSRPRSRCPSRRARSVVAGGAVWITDGLHDTVVPVDVRSNRVLARRAVGRGAAGVTADGRRRVGRERDRRDGLAHRPARRAGSRRRSTSAARRSEIDGGPGGVWVTSHGL